MKRILKPLSALRKLLAIILVAYVSVYYLFPSGFPVKLSKNNLRHIAIIDAGVEFAEDFETEKENLNKPEGLGILLYHSGLLKNPGCSHLSLFADAKPTGSSVDLFCRYCSFIFYG